MSGNPRAGNSSTNSKVISMNSASTTKSPTASSAKNNGGGMYQSMKRRPGGNGNGSSGSNSHAVGGSLLGSSRLSGNSSVRGHGGAGGNKRAIRVLVEGKDLTPLSLLDETESLAVPTGGSSKDGSTLGDKSVIGSGLNVLAGSGLVLDSAAANAANKANKQDQQPLKPLLKKDSANKSQVAVPSSPKGKSNNNSNNNNNNNEEKKRNEDDLSRRGRLRKPTMGEEMSSSSGLSSVDLQEVISMELCETPTTTLFSMIGVCVGLEAAEHKLVSERNVLYEKLCQVRAEGSDLYTSRPTQTLIQELKSTEVSTGAPPVLDSSCQVTSWDIHDNLQNKPIESSENDLLLGGKDDKIGADNSKNASSSNNDIENPESGEEDTTKDAETNTAEGEEDIVEEEEKSSSATSQQKKKISTGDPLSVKIAQIRSAQVEQLVATSVVSPGCLLPINESSEIDHTNQKNQKKTKKHHRGSALTHGSASLSGSATTATTGTESSSLGKSPKKRGQRKSIHTSDKNTNQQEEGGSNKDEDGEAHGEEYITTNGGSASDPADQLILESPSLIEALKTVERGIQQNVYHQKHLLYRAMPIADEEYRAKQQAELDGVMDPVLEGNENDDDEALDQTTINEGNEGEENVDGEGGNSNDAAEAGEADEENKVVGKDPVDDGGAMVDSILTGRGMVEEEEEEEPEIQLLWKFQCEEAKGRTVSCMSWNKVNQDLLAVSYCQFQFADQRDGLILFWTLKNPEYPERVIKCESGVCSLDFSQAHPSLLAAGMYDGTVAIYDLHREGEKGNKPVLDSSRMPTQHKDAVWQVKWVSKSERGEVLVSLSTDGRVTEWSLKKGLASTDLMVLKRVHVPPELGGSGEGIISRTAAGLSLDFPINDPGIYYAGTEDGTIHRCSCSYNEQYLETYFGHSGPVYKLRCSPFWPEAFLTCSADWSIRLWEPEHDEPLLHFQSVDLADVVHDVAWSTSQSTVFGSVTGDGRIEIWDLSKNTLDPVITYFIDPASERKAKLRRTASSATTAMPPDPPTGSNTTTDGSGNNNSTTTTTSEDDPNGAGSAERTDFLPGGPGFHGVSKEKQQGSYFSSIAFAYNAPIIVAGSSQGVIDVFRVRGLNSTYENDEEAALILQNIVEQNQK